MRIGYFLIFIFILCISSPLLAQRCGTDNLHEINKTQNPELYNEQELFKAQITEIVKQKEKQNALLKLSAVEEIYIIPVVVHVVHNSSSGTIGGANNVNITDAQITSQIDVLNEDFRRKAGTPGFNSLAVGADTKIEFCLATIDPNGNSTTGITRTYNSKATWNHTTDEAQLKALIYWPADQYLNIWVCNLETGILGFSAYPGGTPLQGLGSDGGAAEDGVVIDYKAFGKGGVASSPYNQGRTTTHEVGHWLGLLHTWGDTYCGTDYVSDTPPDAKANQDLDCLDSSDCDNNGIYAMDMTNNYMDYSVDNCMNIFTEGQKIRMRTAIENSPRRMALKNSIGCCGNGGNIATVPFTEGFETSDFLSQGWEISNTNSNVTWTTTSPGGFNNSSSSIFVDNSQANLGDLDYITTPFINFKSVQPVLRFDLAYANDITPGTDTLVVSYSTNCRNWIPIATYYGNSIVTSTKTASNFSPAAEDWKTMEIDLNPLNFKPFARIRFENRSNKKNNIYLDNINIYPTSPTIVITPRPNPVSDVLRLEVIFEGHQDVTFEIFDLLGQKIYKSTDLQQISYTKSINMESFFKGMYIVKVTVADQTETKKILLDF